MTCHYINLTNGIEAIPLLKSNDIAFHFLRIQSTVCEQKDWDRLIQELDYDFLMNVALGNECIIYDYGARKQIPRAVYQGIEFIKYVLYRRWLDKEYVTNVSRSKKGKINSNKYFSYCYERLNRKTKKKLDYFKSYVVGEISITARTDATIHDGDKKFYGNIIKKCV